MKLKQLFWNWANAIQIFPVSHILLVVLTIIWIWEIEWFIDLDSPNLVLALILAFIISCYGPLFLIHNNLKNKNLINRILQIWSIIIWWLYYVLLDSIEIDDVSYIEWLLYLRIMPLALLWISLIIALLHRKQESKIRFSWTNLLIAIVFGWLAWSIIRWWIAGALASIEALFDVYINSDFYAYVWVISGILLTGSFIFNLYVTFTEDINGKSDFEIKPSRLRKVFWSFIFLPLALIYLAIFWVYGIKILITWIRPKWIIIRLWIWYFSLWIISSYLIYPDRTKTLEIINKILYISFILMSLLMIWAITKRINQYWITINRCFVCYIIAFIIIFSVLSLIFTKKRRLSFICTFSLLAFISVYGWPLSVNNISFNSQVNKLETLLAKKNISLPLTEWALKNTDKESSELIIETLDELVEKYNKDKIINKIINFEYEDRYWSSRSKIREFLGVENDYGYYNYTTYKERNYYQHNQDNESTDVSWYSKMAYFEKYYDIEDTLELEIDNQKYSVNLFDYIELFQEKGDLYAKSDWNNETVPPLEILEDNYKIVINWFNLEENEDTWEIAFSTIKWYILIK